MRQFFKKAIALLKRQRYISFVIVKQRIKTMFKKQKTVPVTRPNGTTNRLRLRPKQRVPLSERHDIIGVALMFFVLSVAYSSIAVWFNISAAGPVPKIMLLPQIVVAVGIIIWKFTKK